MESTFNKISSKLKDSFVKVEEIPIKGTISPFIMEDYIQHLIKKFHKENEQITNSSLIPLLDFTIQHKI